MQPVRREGWTADAACRGLDPDLFHPARGDRRAVIRALAVCAGCPVAAECLDYALRNGITVGIYGGTSGNTRREKLGRKPGGQTKPIEHGTPRGYAAEIRRQMGTCRACRDANNAYLAERKARERAQRRAVA